MTAVKLGDYESVDFTHGAKRPSAAQVCAAWVKVGCPKVFDAMWGDNGTRFRLANFHVYTESRGFRGVCKNDEKAALLICNKAFRKPLNDFSVPGEAPSHYGPRP